MYHEQGVIKTKKEKIRARDLVAKHLQLSKIERAQMKRMRKSERNQYMPFHYHKQG